MSVVSQGILPVSAACVGVLEGVVVAVPLDIAGVQVMVGGVTVPVGDPPNVAVCHLVDAAIAGHHHIVDARRCHMPTEMVSGNAAEAGAELWNWELHFIGVLPEENYCSLCLHFV